MKIYTTIGLAIILTLPVTIMAGSITSDTITIDNGVFSNNLTVENSISAGSINATNDISGGSLNITNDISSGSLNVTNGISGDSLNVTNTISSSSLNISGLSTESQKGDSQVCFNESGDILPCSTTLSTTDGVVTNTLTVGTSISSGSINVTDSISGNTITISGLSTGEERASSPVCYNDSGEILPCTSSFIVPDVSTLIGSWTGNKVYNHNFGTGCHDEEVTVQIIRYSLSDSEFKSITTRNTVLGLDIDDFSYEFVESGYITSSYSPFDELTTFTLTFDSYGNAEGEWFENNTDCLGTWSLTKDY